MTAPFYRKSGKYLRGCLFGVLGGMLLHAAAFAAATVQEVSVDAGGEIIEVALSQRTTYKVLQLDPREVMVAFKSADLASGATPPPSGAGIVKQLSIESLPGRVVSLMLEASGDIREVQARWLGEFALLEVRLVPEDAAETAEIPVKRRKFKKEADMRASAEDAVPVPSPSSPEASPAPPADEPAPSEIEAPEPEAPGTPVDAPRVFKSAPEGDAFLAEIAGGDCAQAPEIESVVSLCRDDQWRGAFELLDAGISPLEEGECQAERYYLRAYAAFKMNRAGRSRLYLDAASYFQEALSYYPGAACAPLATLTLATIYERLASVAEAKGYYKLILKNYPDHDVAPEALLNLGALYAKDGKQVQAISTLRQYLASYPESSRATEARLALGKSLYETSEYEEALSLIDRAVAEDPRFIYEDREVLLDLGNIHYQLGQMEKALETITHSVNLFPESEDTPDLLTRIGDILKESGQPEKAKKIYRLVMDRYPETDGAAVSAIRYAGALIEPSEKAAEYRRVMETFSGHPMAMLAVIRLADLQNQDGQYATAIETIRDIMSDNLKDLKNEAEYVMGASFTGYFRELSEEEGFLAVMAAYEKDRALINRFENPDVLEGIGAAFLEGKLYDRAGDLFQKAYEASSVSSRSPSLYYHLGVTFQELGNEMQAREMFSAYFRRCPENEKDPDAYLRMGELLAGEEAWDRALNYYEAGYRRSETDAQRADFLTAHADVFENTEKFSEVPDLLVKAINLMAGSSEVSKERLMRVYRHLGEVYMKLSAFQKAGDAFTMALEFSDGSRPPSLLYLLAESQMEAGDTAAARAVLGEVIGTGDLFWSRMAGEELRSIDLQEKLDRVRAGDGL